MFWTIVLAILFVVYVLPLLLGLLGAIIIPIIEKITGWRIL